jgi:hypothetical protein
MVLVPAAAPPKTKNYIALQHFNFNRSKMIAALRFLHSPLLIEML